MMDLCPACKGTGWIVRVAMKPIYVTCPVCNGKGSSSVPSPLRCKDERFGWWMEGDPAWCPFAREMEIEEVPAEWEDMRCINWLRICTKTGKIVVHNKKCDVVKMRARVCMHYLNDADMARDSFDEISDEDIVAISDGEKFVCTNEKSKNYGVCDAGTCESCPDYEE